MPTLTDSTSLSLQQVDFIISRSDVPLGYANRSLQGEGMQWEGLEHPHGPVGSCSRVGGSWAVGVLCGFTFLSCGWLLTLRANRLFLMGMSKGTGSGVSSKLQLCSSCCFSPFRLLSGKGDAGGGRVGISPLPLTGGGGEGRVLVVSVFSPAFLQVPGPCRDPIIDATSPISADIGPNLGSMITSHIRSSTDGALGSLQSLLQGTGLIPGRLARGSEGWWNQEVG